MQLLNPKKKKSSHFLGNQLLSPRKGILAMSMDPCEEVHRTDREGSLAIIWEMKNLFSTSNASTQC